MAKRPRSLTEKEQETLLQQFYDDLEDERDPTVVEGQFIGDEEEVDFHPIDDDAASDDENDDDPDQNDIVGDDSTETSTADNPASEPIDE